MSKQLQQTSPVVGIGTHANRPDPTGAGMEQGYLYFETDTKTLFILQVAGVVKTWVQAAAAAP